MKQGFQYPIYFGAPSLLITHISRNLNCDMLMSRHGYASAYHLVTLYDLSRK